MKIVPKSAPFTGNSLPNIAQLFHHYDVHYIWPVFLKLLCSVGTNAHKKQQQGRVSWKLWGPRLVNCCLFWDLLIIITDCHQLYLFSVSWVVIHRNIVLPTSVTPAKNVWPHLREWFMVSFSTEAFPQRETFWGMPLCRVALPLPQKRYVSTLIHNTWKPSAATGSLWCGDCLQEPADSYSHTYKAYGCINRCAHVDTQCTNNSVWVGVNVCVTCIWSVFDVCERCSCYSLFDS